MVRAAADMLGLMRDVVPPSPEPAAGPLHWRVAPALPWLKFTGAAALVALGALFAVDTVALVVAVIAALALAVWAVRDLLAPVRVAADATGVTVLTGFAGRRQVPWVRVERIRVDTRSRLGLRGDTLEIDAGDALHLFNTYDLDAPPAEVAALLENLRTGQRPPT